jgi:hypothetical protein
MKHFFTALLSLITMSALAQIDVTSTGDSEFSGLATFKHPELFSAVFERGFTDQTTPYHHHFTAGNAHILGRTLVLQSSLLMSPDTPSITTYTYRIKNISDKLFFANTFEGNTLHGDILVLDQNRVGIGTDSPNERLEVSSESTTYMKAYTSSATGVSGLILSGIRGTGPVSSTHYIRTQGADHYHLSIEADEGTYFKNNGVTSMFINGVGQVSVGTESIRTPFFVSGANQTEGPSIPKVLAVADPSDHTKTISLGFDTTYDAGVIASVDAGTGWRSTLIQPHGGYVGIGVTNPTRKLDVSGNFRSIYNSTGWAAWIENSSTIGTNSGLVVTAGDDASDHTLLLRQRNGTETLTVRGNGNVGIGMTSPNEKLVVDSEDDLISRFQNSSSSDVVKGIRLNAKNLSGGWRFLDIAIDAEEDAIGFGMGTSTGNLPIGKTNLDFAQLVIHRQTGNVGIGTTDTFGHKLAVDGKATFKNEVLASEFKVYTFGANTIGITATPWPDYVFENDYKLLSLEEVEDHINEKGHLPNVPSAKDVEEEGSFSLGEMNKKLLEKVEELTLYLIEQNKQLKEQQLQLKKQNQRIKDLEKEMKTR